MDRAAAQRTKNLPHPERGSVLPEKIYWPSIAVFLILAFGLSWLVALPIWLSGEGLVWPFAGLFIGAMMFTPAISALVMVFLVRRPANIPRLLGLSPIRPWGRTIGFTLIAGAVFTLIPIIAVLLGAALSLLQLDLENFGAYREALHQQGVDPDGLGLPLKLLVVITFLGLPINVLFTCFATFGEELGWRGWLIPALRPIGTWMALVLSGVIWGLWHAPIILLGYNYQQPNALGLALMVAWTIFPGILLGWLRLRTASVWPAVIAHGAINTATNTSFLLLAAGQEQQNIIWGSLLGWPGLILMGALMLVLVFTGAWRKQAQPGLRLAESIETGNSFEANSAPATDNQ